MSIDGMKDLERKLTDVSRMDVKKETARAIQTVRNAAVRNVHADTGELRQSIFTDVWEEGDSIIGECYTNKEYAIYHEFGTGSKGQEKHDGISPDVTPAYTQTPWWIHESQIDERVAEKYHMFSIDTPDGKFYQSSGSPAYPFMYPALKDNEDEILKDFAADFTANLEEIIK